MKHNDLVVRWLGQRAYPEVWRAMQHFTTSRTPDTRDEIWLLEHPPVYTVGVRGSGGENGNDLPTEIHGIPVLRTDRGGLITYHGPGQLIAYTLIDLARKKISVRDLVSALENATIALLRQYGLVAAARNDAPGVYVQHAKIASLGLRVRKFRSYHGLSLNVNLDLTPFHHIDPCGFRNLAVTRLADLGVAVEVHEIAVPLLGCLMEALNSGQVHANLQHLPNQERQHHEQSA